MGRFRIPQRGTPDNAYAAFDPAVAAELARGNRIVKGWHLVDRHHGPVELRLENPPHVDPVRAVFDFPPGAGLCVPATGTAPRDGESTAVTAPPGDAGAPGAVADDDPRRPAGYLVALSPPPPAELGHPQGGSHASAITPHPAARRTGGGAAGCAGAALMVPGAVLPRVPHAFGLSGAAAWACHALGGLTVLAGVAAAVTGTSGAAGTAPGPAPSAHARRRSDAGRRARRTRSRRGTERTTTRSTASAWSQAASAEAASGVRPA